MHTLKNFDVFGEITKTAHDTTYYKAHDRILNINMNLRTDMLSKAIKSGDVKSISKELEALIKTIEQSPSLTRLLNTATLIKSPNDEIIKKYIHNHNSIKKCELLDDAEKCFKGFTSFINELADEIKDEIKMTFGENDNKNFFSESELTNKQDFNNDEVHSKFKKFFEETDLKDNDVLVNHPDNISNDL